MKRWLRIIFRIVRYGIPMVFFVLFTYPKRDKISRMYIFKRLKFYLTNIHRDLDAELYITGLENIPNEQSFLITPNHQSLVDGSVLFEVFNDPLKFVTKGELMKVPVAKHILGVMGSIFMNRDELKEELRVMRKVKKSLLEDNVKWVIYPEGTRTRNHNYRLNDFKAGAYKFPMAIGKTIIPCAIHGSGRLLSGKFNYKKYPIHIHFFKPLTKNDYKGMSTQEISSKCKKMIQEKVDEFIEMDKKIIQKR